MMDCTRMVSCQWPNSARDEIAVSSWGRPLESHLSVTGWSLGGRPVLSDLFRQGLSNGQSIHNKEHKLKPCGFIAGPASQTVGQHLNNIIPTSHVQVLLGYLTKERKKRGLTFWLVSDNDINNTFLFSCFCCAGPAGTHVDYNSFSVGLALQAPM